VLLVVAKAKIPPVSLTLQQELGKTVIFVTHDIQEAFVLASRIGLMQQGQMVMLGTPEEFLLSPQPEAQAFMRCLRSLETTGDKLC
jgi:osmoprotectant transport system ATP-binding protein